MFIFQYSYKCMRFYLTFCPFLGQWPKRIWISFLLFVQFFPHDFCRHKLMVLQNSKRSIFCMRANTILKRQKHVWICITPFEQCGLKCLVIAMYSVQTSKHNSECRKYFSTYQIQYFYMALLSLLFIKQWYSNAFLIMFTKKEAQFYFLDSQKRDTV